MKSQANEHLMTRLSNNHLKPEISNPEFKVSFLWVMWSSHIEYFVLVNFTDRIGRLRKGTDYTLCKTMVENLVLLKDS